MIRTHSEYDPEQHSTLLLNVGTLAVFGIKVVVAQLQQGTNEGVSIAVSSSPSSES
jgi:hypothetical protein